MKYHLAALLSMYSALIIANQSADLQQTPENDHSVTFCRLNTQKEKINTIDDLCEGEGVLQKAYIDDITAQSITTRYQMTDRICALTAGIQKLCSFNATIKNLVVDSSFRFITPLRARAAVGNTTVYSLGTPLLFDMVISDPSNGFSTTPPRFVVPETGNYIATVQLYQEGINGPLIIANAPLAVLELYINDQLFMQQQNNYFNFSSVQTLCHTALLPLQKGDAISYRYKIFVYEGTQGLIEYPGTVMLIGKNSSSPYTFFAIHYLSSENNVLDPRCDTVCTTTTLAQLKRCFSR